MSKDSLTNLLSQLNVQSSHSEHSQVEETSLKLLSSGCSNPNVALKHCLVSLIKQDKYAKALETLSKYKNVDEKYGNQFRLEKLYIFYKLNNFSKFEKLYSTIVFEDVETLLQNTESQLEPLRGVLHIRAQFCYKNGKHDEAYKLYNYLSAHNGSETDNVIELACNERVPLTTQPELMILYPVVHQVSDESYDMLFNESIVLVAQGHFDESIQLLEKALHMAKLDEFQDDINAIELQLSYIYQLMGENEKSKNLLKPLLEKLTPGSALYLIAKNNEEAFVDFSKYSTNLNLVLRELNVEKVNTLNLQNFTFDQWTTLQNNCMFLKLFDNVKINSKSSILSRTLQNYTNLVDNVPLEPYQTQSKKLYHFTIKNIKNGINGSLIGAILLTVQLLVTEKQWDNAIRLCETAIDSYYSSKQETSHKLGASHIIVAYLLIELYNATGRNNSKSILLNKLANKKNGIIILSLNEKSESEKEMVNKLHFWKHVAFQYLTLNKTDEAKRIFYKLMKNGYFKEHMVDENITQILSSNESNLFDLEKVSRLIANVDAESLIESGIKSLDTKLAKSGNAIGAISKIAKKKLEVKKQKKKEYKLKKFLATHDIENKTADPERWIPLRDRSTYRPKKKQLAKQTQGGAMSKKTEQDLDISKKTAKKPQTTGNKQQNKKGRK